MDIDVPDYVQSGLEKDIEQWVSDRADEIYFDPDQAGTYIDLSNLNYKNSVSKKILSLSK